MLSSANQRQRCDVGILSETQVEVNRNMDQKTVEKLEEKIEEAIAEIIVKMGLKKLPLLPSRHTMHLMAKAAVTVYEAAVENQQPEE